MNSKLITAGLLVAMLGATGLIESRRGGGRGRVGGGRTAGGRGMRGGVSRGGRGRVGGRPGVGRPGRPGVGRPGRPGAGRPGGRPRHGYSHRGYRRGGWRGLALGSVLVGDLYSGEPVIDYTVDSGYEDCWRDEAGRLVCFLDDAWYYANLV